MIVALLAATAALPLITEIPLVDFQGTDPSTTHEWEAKNDPVMGGRSYSVVKVENVSALVFRTRASWFHVSLRP